MTPDHEDRQAQAHVEGAVWRRVPREPTDAMAHMGGLYSSQISVYEACELWKTMFDAAPREQFGFTSPSEEASAFLRTEGE